MVSLAVCLGGCGGDRSGRNVAEVAGRSITREQFAHWLTIARYSAGNVVPDRSLRTRVMESLISAEWTRLQASALGVRVTNGEAEQQLAVVDYSGRAGLGGQQLFSGEAELRKSLALRGLTHADRLSIVGLNLLATKVEKKSRILAEQRITHAQIAKYYRQHRARFVVPEEREFMILQNGSRSVVVRAKREVEAGMRFLDIAKRVSIDEEAPNGVQRLKRGEEEPEFVAHVFAATLHKLVGPIRQGVDYYMFELTRITPPRQRTLGEAETTIRRLLVERKPDEAVVGTRAGWKARTSCRPGYVVSLCGHYAGTK